MAAEGRNQGFDVLDEFDGKAVHAPTVPLADPLHRGYAEGMRILPEVTCDGSAPSNQNVPHDENGRTAEG